MIDLDSSLGLMLHDYDGRLSRVVSILVTKIAGFCAYEG